MIDLRKSILLFLIMAFALPFIGCADEDDDASHGTKDDTETDDTESDDTRNEIDDTGDDTVIIDETCLFQVNNNDDLYHKSPIVAMNDAGKFVIVWLRNSYGSGDDDKDVDDESIMARFFSEDGFPTTDPIPVAMHFTDALVAAGNEKSLIAWTSNNPVGVYAQMYAWEGTPLGNSFLLSVGSSDSAYLAGVTMKENSEFLVWYYMGDIDAWDYYLQRFNEDGDPVDEKILLGSGKYGESAGFIGLADDGRFVRVWTDYSDETNFMVLAQLYNADGTTNGNAFMVPEEEQIMNIAMGLATAPDGHFVVEWGSDTGIMTRLYDSYGFPLNDATHVNEPSRGETIPSSIGMAPDGRYIATWPIRGEGGYKTALKFRQFDADGNIHGTEAYAFDYQYTPSYGYPWVIGVSSAFSFILVMDRYDQNLEYTYVVARRFDADGNPLCQGE